MTCATTDGATTLAVPAVLGAFTGSDHLETSIAPSLRRPAHRLSAHVSPCPLAAGLQTGPSGPVAAAESSSKSAFLTPPRPFRRAPTRRRPSNRCDQPCTGFPS